jgi:hypothetical protein
MLSQSSVSSCFDFLSFQKESTTNPKERTEIAWTEHTSNCSELSKCSQSKAKVHFLFLCSAHSTETDENNFLKMEEGGFLWLLRYGRKSRALQAIPHW